MMGTGREAKSISLLNVRFLNALRERTELRDDVDAGIEQSLEEARRLAGDLERYYRGLRGHIQCQ